MSQKILVIDGDEEVRREYKTLLREQGYSVTLMLDGYQAQQCKDEYSMVVLELKLKKIDGIRLMESWLETKKFPILVCSKYLDVYEEKLSQLPGWMSRIRALCKPVDGETFIAMVTRMVEAFEDPALQQQRLLS